MRGFAPVPMAFSLILLGLMFPLTSEAQHPPQEKHLPRVISLAHVDKLTLVNLGETYQDLPSSNSLGGRPRSQLTLKVGIRLNNISSDHVMTLATNCFCMVAKSVFREPLVGPIEVPNDFFSPSENLINPCQDLEPDKTVTVMPGKYYEIVTRLKFVVVEDTLADPPQSVNPGVYFLRATMAVGVSWDVHEHETSVWEIGQRDSNFMKFTVKGRSKRRRT